MSLEQMGQIVAIVVLGVSAAVGWWLAFRRQDRIDELQEALDAIAQREHLLERAIRRRSEE